MARYYVNSNAQANGDHEGHRAGGAWLPSLQNRIYLGEFSSCGLAVARARAYYTQVNGGARCSPACHTSWIGIVCEDQHAAVFEINAPVQFPVTATACHGAHPTNIQSGKR